MDQNTTIDLAALRPKLRSIHVKPTIVLTPEDRRALAHIIASPGFETVLAFMCDEIGAKMRSAANNLANPAMVLEVYGHEQELRQLESLRGNLLTILERSKG